MSQDVIVIDDDEDVKIPDPYQEESDERAAMLYQPLSDAVSKEFEDELKEREEQESQKRKRKAPGTSETSKIKRFLCATCVRRGVKIDTAIFVQLAREAHFSSQHKSEVDYKADLDKKDDKIQILKERGIDVIQMPKDFAERLRDAIVSKPEPEKRAVVEHVIAVYTNEGRFELDADASPSLVSSEDMKEISMQSVFRTAITPHSIRRILTPDYLESLSTVAGQQRGYTTAESRFALDFLASYATAALDKSDVSQMREFVLSSFVGLVLSFFSSFRANNSHNFILFAPSAMEASTSDVIFAESAPGGEDHKFSLGGLRSLLGTCWSFALGFVAAFQDAAFVKTHEDKIATQVQKLELFAFIQECALLQYHVASYEFFLTKPTDSPSDINAIRKRGKIAHNWAIKIMGFKETIPADKLSLADLVGLFKMIANIDPVPFTAPALHELDDNADLTAVMSRALQSSARFDNADIPFARRYYKQMSNDYHKSYTSGLASAELQAASISILAGLCGDTVEEEVFLYEMFYVVAVQLIWTQLGVPISQRKPPTVNQADVKSLKVASVIAMGVKSRVVDEEEEHEEAKRPTPSRIKPPAVLGAKKQANALLEAMKKATAVTTTAAPPAPLRRLAAPVTTTTRPSSLSSLPSPASRESTRVVRRIAEEDDEDAMVSGPRHELDFGHASYFMSSKPSSRR